MTSRLVQQLTGVRDLKRILETTVRELGDSFNADSCQVILSNPLDPNMTSICEFQAEDEEAPDCARVTVPLVLQGRTFGSVSVSRQNDLSLEEVSDLRVLLGELGDIIRLAQINDVVQRDTFRETFLVEIGNVMSYSLGIGDALFMVVNILGKALNVSRCLFICTDDAQAGWKCYEFWQQEKVKSCQEYYWPSNDSPFVAQALLSKMPITVYEGQENSYVSPVQDELRFIGVKSLLGVPLTSTEGTHGCVILQQCDYRRAWTRAETDMVQNVADRVAEALLKLPPEKRVREPIMQLHQRIVEAPSDGDGGQSTVDRRRALKGALGQQAIPSARQAPPAPPKPEPTPPTPPAPTPPTPVANDAAATAVPPTPTPAPTPAPTAAPSAAPTTEATPPKDDKKVSKKSQEIDVPQPKIKAVTSARSSDAIAKPDAQPGDPPSTTGIREFALDKTGADQEVTAEKTGLDPSVAPPVDADPYADLDFGDLEDIPDDTTVGADPSSQDTTAALPTAETEPAAASAQATPATPPQPTAAPAAAETTDATPAAPTAPATAAAEATTAEAGGGFGDLDSIPTPKAAPAAGGQDWGNLDAIPTPTKGVEKAAGGLKGSMLARAKAASAASPLMSSLKKSAPAEPAEEAPPAEPINEEEAKKKLDAIMADSNATSDYIFATEGLDPRMLGRIDGWVAQIEQKDKYLNGHARQVAEYSIAIAQALDMKAEDVNVIRQAALVHDLGKLGIAKSLLQKSEEQLEADEYVLKMGHSVAGAQLLESFPDLQHLAPIVQAHHEEVDGEGFPQGLKGDEIPLFARIIAVANGYHELVADKTFEKGLDPQDAQDQMVEEAGKLFDPTFVEALVQAIKDGKVSASM